MKKKLDSISATKTTETTAEAATDPVVETIAAHQQSAAAASIPAQPTTAEQPATTSPATEPVVATEKATANAEPATAGEAKTETATTTPVEGATAPADSFETLFPEPAVSISSPPSWIWWVLLLVVSLGLAGIGYALAKNKISGWLSLPTTTPSTSASITPSTKPSSSPSATPTSTATPTPTPSPSSSPTSSKFTLRVLNGTTKPGAAATAKSILEKAGITVRTTGNAQKQNYAQTTIYYKTGKKAEAQQAVTALSTYDSVLQQSDTLASPDDVLVVIGLK